MADGALLLTGATGFLGAELLARVVGESERPVVALVRAEDDDAAQARVDATLREILGEPVATQAAGRVRGVAADLERDRLGLGKGAAARIAAEVTTIVHCAASVSFALPLPESRAVNVDGTRRMLTLARRCARLERFAYISTAFVSGRHPGRFSGEDLELGQTFRNAYEQSKQEAEIVVRAAADELPIQVFRPSIVVGEQQTGWTSSFNVLYQPLRAFSRGLYSILPGRVDALVDAVPVDYVADGIWALLAEPVSELQTHLLVAGDRAANVGELARIASEYFNLPVPQLIDPDVFERDVVPAVQRDGDALTKAVIEQSGAYFPYFAVETVFDDAATRPSLTERGITVGPLNAWLPRLLDFAVATRWGRRAPTRAEALQAAA